MATAEEFVVSERNLSFAMEVCNISTKLHPWNPMDVRLISRPYNSADLLRVGMLNSKAQQALLESILEEGKEIQRRKREQLGRHKSFWRQ